jgi:hypothetical protein
LWTEPAPGGEEQPLAGMPQLHYADDWFVGRDGIYYTNAGSVSFYYTQRRLARRYHDEFRSLG